MGQRCVRAIRLVAIWLLLQERLYTIAELAERFDVQKQTIRRDLDDMRQVEPFAAVVAKRFDAYGY